jgi:hypothetical protein
MAIQIPGSAFQGISRIGARAPEAGFYAVSVVEIANPDNKPGKRRLYVTFDNGYKTFDFMNFPFDDNGNQLQGLNERQVRGQLAAVRSILESLGYSGQDIEAAQSVSDNWFLTKENGGRKAYIEFVPGQQGVQGSYNKIVRWMTKTEYEALSAADTKSTTVAAPAAAPATTAAPNPAVVTNGASAPSIQATLPPPPSVAQGIVS